MPPKALYIKDKSDQRVYAIAGPYNEDDALDLICIAENGNFYSFLFDFLIMNPNTKKVEKSFR